MFMKKKNTLLVVDKQLYFKRLFSLHLDRESNRFGDILHIQLIV